MVRLDSDSSAEPNLDFFYVYKQRVTSTMCVFWPPRPKSRPSWEDKVPKLDARKVCVFFIEITVTRRAHSWMEHALLLFRSFNLSRDFGRRFDSSLRKMKTTHLSYLPTRVHSRSFFPQQDIYCFNSNNLHISVWSRSAFRFKDCVFNY